MPALNRGVLPGFRLSLSYSLLYLSLLVFIPLAACFLKASSLSPHQFWEAVWTERARAAYALTFAASLLAASINVLLGLLIAWVLVRYEFPFKRLFDSLIDLPFALPTAVAGLVYSSLYVRSGWLGQFLVPLGIEGAYSRLAIVLVLTFIGLPFVVRTVQPVLETLEAEVRPDFSSRSAPDFVPGAIDRLCTGVCPRPRRIRLRRIRVGQYAVQDRDSACFDCPKAGRVCLR